MQLPLPRHFVKDRHGFTGWKEAGDDSPFVPEELRIGRAIAMELKRHYPNHYWKVEVNIPGGVAKVLLEMFSDWQEIIHLSDLASDPHGDLVKKAGGAFLERYRMPRSGFDVDRTLEAKQIWRPDWTRRLRPPD